MGPLRTRGGVRPQRPGAVQDDDIAAALRVIEAFANGETSTPKMRAALKVVRRGQRARDRARTPAAKRAACQGIDIPAELARITGRPPKG
jgi:hypothetical protein